jgi:mannose PTS system EIIA component
MEEGRHLVNAVVVTHGFLGAELIRTAEAILGPQDGIAFISNANSAPEDLSDQVRLLLAQEEAPIFLFVDVRGGSCSQACQQIRRMHPKLVVICGINLPMLLDFFVNRDRVTGDELAARLIDKGREGIRCL